VNFSINRQKIGKLGETAALNFLKNKGYLICATNYHSRFGEIDIIAKNKSFIVFVEVKTRRQSSIASPAEFVDRLKCIKIIKTALFYLSEETCEKKLQPRFDIIEVLTPNSPVQISESKLPMFKFRINHIENAFVVEDEDLIL
jgi:putative endonuclease